MKNFKFHSRNLDGILFEHRNKKYGAFELRKSYDSRLIKAFFSALLLIATSIGVTVLIHSLTKKNLPDVPTYTSIMMDLKKEIVVQQKVPLAALPMPKPNHSKADVPFRVLKDSLIVKDKSNMDTASKSANTTLTINGNHDSLQGTLKDTSTSVGNATATGTDPIASSQPFDLVAVDEIPLYQGGESALMRFLEKNIHYNEQAKMAGVKGRMYASFIINSSGKVEMVKILRGLGYGLDEEVIRVLNSMPPWKPGYFRGKPVSTIMNIPVSFNLLQ